MSIRDPGRPRKGESSFHRERADAALRESEERYRALFDRSLDCVYVHDFDGRFLEASPATLDLLGYAREDILSLDFSSLLDDDQRDKAAAALSELKRTGMQQVSTMYRLRRKNGDYVDVETRASVIFRDGSPFAVQGVARDITDRKRAQERLRESEARVRSVVESSPDGIAIHRGGLLVYVNPAAVKMIGATSSQDLVGRPLLDLVHPDFHGVVAERVESNANYPGRLPVIEEKFVKLDGTAIDVEVEARSIIYDGAPAIQVVVRDITERKQAEQALRESEERHRTILQMALDGYWLADMQGRLLEVNDAYCRMSGYDAEELLPLRIADLEAAEEAGETAAHIQTIIMQGEDRFESRHRRKDGSVFDVAVRVQYQHAEGGRLVVFLQDITERKQAEADLAKSEARFRSYFQLPLLGMAISSLETGWIEINDQVCSMMGYSRDEMLRMTWVEVTHPDDLAADLERFGRLLAGEIDQYSIEKRYVRKGGEAIWANVNVGCVRTLDGAVDFVVAFIQDITPQKQAEMKKDALEAQLRQAQKMESVGRLAGGVAHDFNNMLGVILGHVELALEGVDPAGPLHEDLIEIKQAARRSAELTGQLLAFARRQTVTPQVLDLNETIRGMLKMLERLIGEDVVLSFRPGSNLWSLRVDPSQIDQIVANLCVNARDAFEGVGRVAIETKNCTLDDTFCEGHQGSLPGDYVCLTVGDDGRGMDPETLAHLFEPFFTTKEVGEGTGLGLATVYGIVKQNCGFIDVDSEPGQGATFTIYLPRHEGRIARTEPEMPGVPAARGHETILVVEDEPTILKMTERMLAGQGYTVLTAVTPGEAMRVAGEHRGDIHLLMTDVIMPEMNGRDLAKNLLSLYPQVRRLFMSGYTADIIAHHGVLGEGVHFLQKPFSMQDLATKVREALDGE